MQSQISISSYILLCIAVGIILISTTKIKPIKILHTMVGLLLILIALDCFYDLTLSNKILISAIEICILSYWLSGSMLKTDSSITNPASW